MIQSQHKTYKYRDQTDGYQRGGQWGEMGKMGEEEWETQVSRDGMNKTSE